MRGVCVAVVEVEKGGEVMSGQPLRPYPGPSLRPWPEPDTTEKLKAWREWAAKLCGSEVTADETDDEMRERVRRTLEGFEELCENHSRSLNIWRDWSERLLGQQCPDDKSARDALEEAHGDLSEQLAAHVEAIAELGKMLIAADGERNALRNHVGKREKEVVELRGERDEFALRASRAELRLGNWKRWALAFDACDKDMNYDELRVAIRSEVELADRYHSELRDILGDDVDDFGVDDDLIDAVRAVVKQRDKLQSDIDEWRDASGLDGATPMSASRFYCRIIKERDEAANLSHKFRSERDGWKLRAEKAEKAEREAIEESRRIMERAPPPAFDPSKDHFVGWTNCGAGSSGDVRVIAGDPGAPSGAVRLKSNEPIRPVSESEARDRLLDLAAKELEATKKRAEVAEAERDELQELVDEWKDASGIVDSSGDPDGITPKMAEKYWKGLESERDRCAVSVKETQARLDIIRGVCDGRLAQVEAGEKVAQEIEPGLFPSDAFECGGV